MVFSFFFFGDIFILFLYFFIWFFYSSYIFVLSSPGWFVRDTLLCFFLLLQRYFSFSFFWVIFSISFPFFSYFLFLQVISRLFIYLFFLFVFFDSYVFWMLHSRYVSFFHFLESCCYVVVFVFCFDSCFPHHVILYNRYVIFYCLLIIGSVFQWFSCFVTPVVN